MSFQIENGQVSSEYSETEEERLKRLMAEKEAADAADILATENANTLATDLEIATLQELRDRKGKPLQEEEDSKTEGPDPDPVITRQKIVQAGVKIGIESGLSPEELLEIGEGAIYDQMITEYPSLKDREFKEPDIIFGHGDILKLNKVMTSNQYLYGMPAYAANLIRMKDEKTNLDRQGISAELQDFAFEATWKADYIAENKLNSPVENIEGSSQQTNFQADNAYNEFIQDKDALKSYSAKKLEDGVKHIEDAFKANPRLQATAEWLHDQKLRNFEGEQWTNLFASTMPSMLTAYLGGKLGANVGTLLSRYAKTGKGKGTVIGVSALIGSGTTSNIMEGGSYLAAAVEELTSNKDISWEDAEEKIRHRHELYKNAEPEVIEEFFKDKENLNMFAYQTKINPDSQKQAIKSISMLGDDGAESPGPYDGDIPMENRLMDYNEFRAFQLYNYFNVQLNPDGSVNKDYLVEEGMNTDQAIDLVEASANSYALFAGLIESGTDFLFLGIGGEASQVLKKSISDKLGLGVFSRTMSRLENFSKSAPKGSNYFSKLIYALPSAAYRTVGTSVGEAVEEELQYTTDVFTTVYGPMGSEPRWKFKTSLTDEWSYKEATESAMGGFLAGGPMGATNLYGKLRRSNDRSINRQLTQRADKYEGIHVYSDDKRNENGKFGINYAVSESEDIITLADGTEIAGNIVEASLSTDNWTEGQTSIVIGGEVFHYQNKEISTISRDNISKFEDKVSKTDLLGKDGKPMGEVEFDTWGEAYDAARAISEGIVSTDKKQRAWQYRAIVGGEAKIELDSEEKSPTSGQYVISLYDKNGKLRHRDSAHNTEKEANEALIPVNKAIESISEDFKNFGGFKGLEEDPDIKKYIKNEDRRLENEGVFDDASGVNSYVVGLKKFMGDRVRTVSLKNQQDIMDNEFPNIFVDGGSTILDIVENIKEAGQWDLVGIGEEEFKEIYNIRFPSEESNDESNANQAERLNKIFAPDSPSIQPKSDSIQPQDSSQVPKEEFNIPIPDESAAGGQKSIDSMNEKELGTYISDKQKELDKLPKDKRNKKNPGFVMINSGIESAQGRLDKIAKDRKEEQLDLPPKVLDTKSDIERDIKSLTKELNKVKDEAPALLRTKKQKDRIKFLTSEIIKDEKSLVILKAKKDKIESTSETKLEVTLDGKTTTMTRYEALKRATNIKEVSGLPERNALMRALEKGKGVYTIDSAKAELKAIEESKKGSEPTGKIEEMSLKEVKEFIKKQGRILLAEKSEDTPAAKEALRKTELASKRQFELEEERLKGILKVTLQEISEMSETELKQFIKDAEASMVLSFTDNIPLDFILQKLDISPTAIEDWGVGKNTGEYVDKKIELAQKRLTQLKDNPIKERKISVGEASLRKTNENKALTLEQIKEDLKQKLDMLVSKFKIKGKVDFKYKIYDTWNEGVNALYKKRMGITTPGPARDNEGRILKVGGWFDPETNTIVVIADSPNAGILPFHEFSHPFFESIARENPKLFKQLWNSIKDDPKFRDIIVSVYEEYKGVYLRGVISFGTLDAFSGKKLIWEKEPSDEFIEEVFAHIMEGLANNKYSKKSDTFMDKVMSLWNAIKDFLFGKSSRYKVHTYKLKPNTTLDELANIIAEDSGMVTIHIEDDDAYTQILDVADESAALIDEHSRNPESIISGPLTKEDVISSAVIDEIASTVEADVLKLLDSVISIDVGEDGKNIISSNKIKKYLPKNKTWKDLTVKQRAKLMTSVLKDTKKDFDSLVLKTIEGLEKKHKVSPRLYSGKKYAFGSQQLSYLTSKHTTFSTELKSQFTKLSNVMFSIGTIQAVKDKPAYNLDIDLLSRLDRLTNYIEEQVSFRYSFLDKHVSRMIKDSPERRIPINNLHKIGGMHRQGQERIAISTKSGNKYEGVIVSEDKEFISVKVDVGLVREVKKSSIVRKERIKLPSEMSKMVKEFEASFAKKYPKVKSLFPSEVYSLFEDWADNKHPLYSSLANLPHTSLSYKNLIRAEGVGGNFERIDGNNPHSREEQALEKAGLSGGSVHRVLLHEGKILRRGHTLNVEKEGLAGNGYGWYGVLVIPNGTAGTAGDVLLYEYQSDFFPEAKAIWDKFNLLYNKIDEEGAVNNTKQLGEVISSMLSGMKEDAGERAKSLAKEAVSAANSWHEPWRVEHSSQSPLGRIKDYAGMNDIVIPKEIILDGKRVQIFTEDITISTATTDASIIFDSIMKALTGLTVSEHKDPKLVSQYLFKTENQKPLLQWILNQDMLQSMKVAEGVYKDNTINTKDWLKDANRGNIAKHHEIALWYPYLHKVIDAILVSSNFNFKKEFDYKNIPFQTAVNESIEDSRLKASSAYIKMITRSMSKSIVQSFKIKSNNRRKDLYEYLEFITELKKLGYTYSFWRKDGTDENVTKNIIKETVRETTPDSPILNDNIPNNFFIKLLNVKLDKMENTYGLKDKEINSIIKNSITSVMFDFLRKDKTLGGNIYDMVFKGYDLKLNDRQPDKPGLIDTFINPNGKFKTKAATEGSIDYADETMGVFGEEWEAEDVITEPRAPINYQTFLYRMGLAQDYNHYKEEATSSLGKARSFKNRMNSLIKTVEDIKIIGASAYFSSLTKRDVQVYSRVFLRLNIQLNRFVYDTVLENPEQHMVTKSNKDTLKENLKMISPGNPFAYNKYKDIEKALKWEKNFHQVQIMHSIVHGQNLTGPDGSLYLNTGSAIAMLERNDDAANIYGDNKENKWLTVRDFFKTSQYNSRSAKNRANKRYGMMPFRGEHNSPKENTPLITHIQENLISQLSEEEALLHFSKDGISNIDLIDILFGHGNILFKPYYYKMTAVEKYKLFVRDANVDSPIVSMLEESLKGMSPDIKTSGVSSEGELGLITPDWVKKGVNNPAFLKIVDEVFSDKVITSLRDSIIKSITDYKSTLEIESVDIIDVLTLPEQDPETVKLRNASEFLTDIVPVEGKSIFNKVTFKDGTSLRFPSSVLDSKNLTIDSISKDEVLTQMVLAGEVNGPKPTFNEYIIVNALLGHFNRNLTSSFKGPWLKALHDMQSKYKFKLTKVSRDWSSAELYKIDFTEETSSDLRPLRLRKIRAVNELEKSEPSSFEDFVNLAEERLFLTPQDFKTKTNRKRYLEGFFDDLLTKLNKISKIEGVGSRGRVDVDQFLSHMYNILESQYPEYINLYEGWLFARFKYPKSGIPITNRDGIPYTKDNFEERYTWLSEDIVKESLLDDFEGAREGLQRISLVAEVDESKLTIHDFKKVGPFKNIVEADFNSMISQAKSLSKEEWIDYLKERYQAKIDNKSNLSMLTRFYNQVTSGIRVNNNKFTYERIQGKIRPLPNITSNQRTNLTLDIIITESGIAMSIKEKGEYNHHKGKPNATIDKETLFEGNPENLNSIHYLSSEDIYEIKESLNKLTGEVKEESKQVFGFLTEEELNLLDSSLKKSNKPMAILGSRGDSAKLFIIEIESQFFKNPDARYVSRNLDFKRDKQWFKDYWRAEANNGFLGNEETSSIELASKLLEIDKDAYIDLAADVSIHNAYKKVWPKYMMHRGANVLKRLKIPFTPVTKSKTMPPIRPVLFNPNDMATRFEGVETNLVQDMGIFGDTYIGDGMTLTSRSVFNSYYTHFGLKEGMRFAKTVFYEKDADDVLMVKHLQTAVRPGMEIFDRTTGEVIWRVNKNGDIIDVKTSERVDVLMTEDEAKVRDIFHTRGEEVNGGLRITMSGQSIGMIKFDESVNKTVSSGIQIHNYETSSELLDMWEEIYLTPLHTELNRLFHLPINTVAKDGTILKLASDKLRDQMKAVISKAEDVDGYKSSSLSHIINGSGKHPTSFAYLDSQLQSKLLLPSLQLSGKPGGRYKYRFNVTGLARKEVSLPLDSRIRDKYEDSGGDVSGTALEIFNRVNQWLKKADIKVKVQRFPVTGRSSSILVRIANVHMDSKIIETHPLDAKEHWEMDADGDEVHVEYLTPEAIAVWEKIEESKQVIPINLNDLLKQVTKRDLSLLNKKNRLAQIASSTVGGQAVGMIANIAVSYGILHNVYDSFEYNGRKIKILNPDEMITWTPIKAKPQYVWKGTVENFIRTWIQAAVDNAEYNLLGAWGYNIKVPFNEISGQEYIMSALFSIETSKGSGEFTMLNVLKDSEHKAIFQKFLHPIVKNHIKPGRIRNGKEFSKMYTMKDTIKESGNYLSSIGPDGSGRANGILKLDSFGENTTIGDIATQHGFKVNIKNQRLLPIEHIAISSKLIQNQVVSKFELEGYTDTIFEPLDIVHRATHALAIVEFDSKLSRYLSEIMDKMKVDDRSATWDNSLNEATAYHKELISEWLALHELRINQGKSYGKDTIDTASEFKNLNFYFQMEYNKLDPLSKALATVLFLRGFQGKITAVIEDMKGETINYSEEKDIRVVKHFPPASEDFRDISVLDNNTFNLYYQEYNKLIDTQSKKTAGLTSFVPLNMIKKRVCG